MPAKARGKAPGDESTNAISPAIYKKLSIEQLLELDVTIVTKHPQKLSQAPSAVQVITGEDVQRSGATSLADALRLASNLEVKQVNSYAWVVSARGFDALFANKLLVMIDGRTVYTPLDAGVFWDAQSVLLQDLDRIEVVSGPGGTLWGANAVNGVINIVTKSARDTQGLYTSGAAGSFLQDYGALRYGGTGGSNLFYRVYAQRFDRDATVAPNGDAGTNAWEMTQGGFRLDWYPGEENTLTLQGDFYAGVEHNTASADSKLDGQNVLGRWTHTFSDTSDMSLQVYWDRTARKDIPSTVSDKLNTFDFDFQHRFALGERQTIVWGTGYRLMRDYTPTTTAFVGFLPEHRDLQLLSAFAQDEIALLPDRLKLTMGTKIEHNDYSGFEVQPSARLAWTPTGNQTIWGAISRAVRTPSRIDVDYYIPKVRPFAIAGGPDFDSEKVIAYEIGYRIQPTPKLSLSLATFYNDYDGIYSVELANPPAPIPYTIQNGTDGQSWGVELSGTFQPVENWRLRGGYTYFHKDLWNEPNHFFSDANLATLGNDPRHQFVLQSMTDLPGHFQFDLTGRFVDALPEPHVAAYFTFDARIAWHFKQIEVALVGQNLWESRHPEFAAGQGIPRSVYGKVTWSF